MWTIFAKAPAISKFGLLYLLQSFWHSYDLFDYQREKTMIRSFSKISQKRIKGNESPVANAFYTVVQPDILPHCCLNKSLIYTFLWAFRQNDLLEQNVLSIMFCLFESHSSIKNQLKHKIGSSYVFLAVLFINANLDCAFEKE